MNSGRRGQERAKRSLVLRILLLVALVFFALPLVWLVSTSLSGPEVVYRGAGLVPRRLTLNNFAEAWRTIDVARYTANTLMVASLVAAGSLGSSAMVGFGFATLPNRHRTLLFSLMISTVMIPPSTLPVARFLMVSRIGWTDSYLPLAVPHLFANPFYVFMFREFFKAIPNDQIESFEIDGANPLHGFLRIALPQSVPVVATVTLFALIGAWNDLLDPLIYLDSPHKFTLSVGMAFVNGLYYSRLHLLVAMAILSLVPIALLFAFAQQLLVRGVEGAFAGRNFV